LVAAAQSRDGWLVGLLQGREEEEEVAEEEEEEEEWCRRDGGGQGEAGAGGLAGMAHGVRRDAQEAAGHRGRGAVLHRGASRAALPHAGGRQARQGARRRPRRVAPEEEDRCVPEEECGRRGPRHQVRFLALAPLFTIISLDRSLYSGDYFKITNGEIFISPLLGFQTFAYFTATVDGSKISTNL
jgi:hypothetical protein